MPKIGHFSFYLPPAGSRDLHALKAIRPLEARAFLREPRTPVPASVTAVLDGAILLSGTQPVKRDWVWIASKIEIASGRKVLPPCGSRSRASDPDPTRTPLARAASPRTPDETRACSRRRLDRHLSSVKKATRRRTRASHPGSPWATRAGAHRMHWHPPVASRRPPAARPRSHPRPRRSFAASARGCPFARPQTRRFTTGGEPARGPENPA
jgi:hypothetical protein